MEYKLNTVIWPGYLIFKFNRLWRVAYLGIALVLFLFWDWVYLSILSEGCQDKCWLAVRLQPCLMSWFVFMSLWAFYLILIWFCILVKSLYCLYCMFWISCLPKIFFNLNLFSLSDAFHRLQRLNGFLKFCFLFSVICFIANIHARFGWSKSNFFFQY